MLVDEHHLEKDETGFSAVRELASVAVPPTLHALLAARIDRLGPSERAVVEAASVIGRSFGGAAVSSWAAAATAPSSTFSCSHSSGSS